MAWAYSDYVTYAPGPARLARFRLHVQEVADALSAELSAAGQSRSSHAIERYQARLEAQEEREEARCGAAHTFTRGVPLLP